MFDLAARKYIRFNVPSGGRYRRRPILLLLLLLLPDSRVARRRLGHPPQLVLRGRALSVRALFPLSFDSARGHVALHVRQNRPACIQVRCMGRQEKLLETSCRRDEIAEQAVPGSRMAADDRNEVKGAGRRAREKSLAHPGGHQRPVRRSIYRAMGTGRSGDTRSAFFAALAACIRERRHPAVRAFSIGNGAEPSTA